jgi:Nuclease-related domain
MRLVQLGGRYMERREQRLWAALACLLGLAATGIVVVVETPGARPLYLGAGAAAVLTALRLGGPVARRLRNVRQGRLGERLVADLLRGLPDDFWLINDVTLGLARGTIDHVLIGPCGVVVIETKRFAGSVRCSGDDWSVNGDRRSRVSQQADSGACAVRHFLSERHPDLAGTALRWVESLIVFTHPLCRLEVTNPRTTIVRYSHLFQVVLELAQKHRMAPSIVEQLAQTLATSPTRGTAAGPEALTVAS